MPCLSEAHAALKYIFLYQEVDLAEWSGGASNPLILTSLRNCLNNLNKCMVDEKSAY